jgi:hypothetical protein
MEAKGLSRLFVAGIAGSWLALASLEDAVGDDERPTKSDLRPQSFATRAGTGVRSMNLTVRRGDDACLAERLATSLAT